MALVVASALSACWFQPGWGPRRAGHNPAERSLTPENVASLTESWSVVPEPGESVLDPLVSGEGAHVVAGNRVATYRLGSGVRRWSRPVCPDLACEFFGWLVGAPVQHRGSVLVPLAIDTTTGGIASFDAASGEPGGGGFETTGGVVSVTVDGTTVAVVSNERADGAYTAMTVLDLADPSRRWWWADGESHHPDAQVAFGDEHVFFTFDDRLMVFERVPAVECPVANLPLCDPVWKTDLGGDGMTPVVSADGDTVYIGNRLGRVRALDAVDGSERWSATAGPGLSAAPTLGDGRLYVPSSDGRVHVFDADGCGAATCAPVWAAATGSPVRTQAALAGGVLYVASEDGSIDAYDAAGCALILCVPLWSGSTGSPVTGGPVVALGHLLVGTADGRLIAYRPD